MTLVNSTKRKEIARAIQLLNVGGEILNKILVDKIQEYMKGIIHPN